MNWRHRLLKKIKGIFNKCHLNDLLKIYGKMGSRYQISIKLSLENRLIKLHGVLSNILT